MGSGGSPHAGPLNGGPPHGADAELLEEFVAAGHREGLVGDPELSGHLENALLFDSVLPRTGQVLDLGSGAGLPGLILAHLRPEQQVLLLDSSARRCRFLERWALRLAPGAIVLQGRAEHVARDIQWRRSCAAVTARAFGRPAVTAECAVGFLEPNGLIVVSEPPTEDVDRWPSPGLRRLGLVPGDRVRRGTSSVQILRSVEVVEDFPRGDGIPASRPIF